MRRELLLVNPIDGSDLLFELLSTVTEDARYGTGIVSILRNVGDLRRATEQIDENYRKMRRRRNAGERRARSPEPDHRLGRRPDHRDRCGRLDVADERSGRAAVRDAGRPRAQIEQRRVQANDAHFSSFVSGMLLSDDQRRVGEVNLLDPATGGADAG